MSLAGGDVGGQSYSAVNLTRRFYWTACLEATLCRMTQRLKQSGVFFHRFSCRWVARCAWWPHSSSVNCWGRRKPRPPWTSGRGLPSWTQVRHTHRCCCADVLTCRRSSWLCVCSLQMICQRRNLLCCINRPTPTRWPTWTSASPPPACSLELRYTWIHHQRINNRIICVYLSYSGWKQTYGSSVLPGKEKKLMKLDESKKLA